MKNQFFLTVFIVQVLTSTSVIAAQDYTVYSNEDLFQMKEQVRIMGEEDRQAYQAERRNRIKNMSQEERQAMRNNQRGMAEKSNNEQRKQLRDGSGGGNQYGKMDGQGKGGGHGKGSGH